ncbi:Helix-turn-helix domain-containing protein [Chitinophaga costaii]|uniref:Helix-turn-helix domain-containing protein n=1 Tax=Chitinophaga costaii TaxID=1335309 RepID=A0A1C3ZXR5_9BACT|nr:helix-turn-helix domain-containing protein [Chitinophaga costaii]PUZ30545.1 helicase [Chitinophaga costaii]SCB87062.1 Helix-turn-helix domain-containing protein [Chitinophaga costaii]
MRNVNIGFSNNEIQSLTASFIETTNCNLFVTGKAGTGKTTFLKSVREQTTKRHVVLAPTGIAAINAQGSTINSFFQVPPGFFLPGENSVNKTDFYNIADIVKNLNYSIAKKMLIKDLELIIIDEISMVRSDQVDLLDRILRHVRDNDHPFGGTQMVFIGDLFQLPPVLRNEDIQLYSEFYTSQFFFSATVFNSGQLVQIEFQQVYRQSDNEFIQILDQIRNNAITDEALSLLNTRQLSISSDKPDDSITIASHNVTAQAVNVERLNALAGPEYIFNGTVTGDFKDSMLPIDPILKLKKGAQVMFIKNDAGETRRYFNGKVGKISHITQDEIKVVFPDEVELTVEKYTWYAYDYSTSEDKNTVTLIPVGAFVHYPIKLAWAITIHKSQGLTFEHAIIDAASSFEAGQVYVALSRVRSLKGLFLQSQITRESIQANKSVLSFYAPMTKHELECLLSDGQRSFLFNRILEGFSLKPAIHMLQDLFARPETFKQKVDAKSLTCFANILGELEALQQVVMRFELEINDAIQHNRELTYLNDRFVAARTYFASKIDEKCLSPFSGTADTISNKKTDQFTKTYWEKLNGLLREKGEEMNRSVEIMRQLATGVLVIQLINAIKEKEIKSDTSFDIKPKSKRGASLNKSIKDTLEMIQSGKTVVEIASIRNLAISTIETHVLDVAQKGLISVDKILNAEKLDTISEAIMVFGGDVYKIREHFGDTFSFFEIRLAICHANTMT